MNKKEFDKFANKLAKEIENMTPEEVDKALRKEGLDPEKIKKEGMEFVKKLSAEAKRRWELRDLLKQKAPSKGLCEGSGGSVT